MRILRQLFRRPPIKMGYIDETRARRSPTRNAQFVSFFTETDCVAHRHTDHHDLRLRRQKRVRICALITVTALCTWFVVESAQALSTF